MSRRSKAISLARRLSPTRSDTSRRFSRSLLVRHESRIFARGVLRRDAPRRRLAHIFSAVAVVKLVNRDRQCQRIGEGAQRQIDEEDQRAQVANADSRWLRLGRLQQLHIVLYAAV